MGLTLTALCVACCGLTIWFAASRVPSLYLRVTLLIIQHAALTRDRVDWPRVRAEALSMARGAKTTQDTYPAIQMVLTKLGDQHSHLLPAESRSAPLAHVQSAGIAVRWPEAVVIRVYQGSPAATAGIRVGDILESVNGREGIQAATVMAPDTFDIRVHRPQSGRSLAMTLRRGSFSFDVLPQARGIDGQIGYIELPGTVSVEPYVTTARARIRAIDTAAICGWVVDLRRNMGGNMWPMLSAVEPLLGDPPLGSFVSSWTTSTWGYPRRPADTAAERFTLKRQMPPVAVLTSPLTLSSGEALAIAFRGRANTRSFGEPTGGLPTANMIVALPDGAHLALTTAREADRTGHVYSGRIQPDDIVKEDWARIESDDDPVMLRAVQWLHAQPACTVP